MCNKKNTWFNNYEDCLSDDKIILKSYIYIYGTNQ